MKTRKPKKPVYTHPRTAYAGIEERLALASLAFSKTWLTPKGQFGHSVRYISKRKGEGWESHFTWIDDTPRINLEPVRREIAHGIEAARLAWWENQHPSKELLAIVANVNARKAA